MSWQRTDENTYIDDTLVTCAEYQLFIDEMRKQRKYHRPDHWTSHQFPKGQAREPILGVRHSDALVFCEWLTKREEMVWKYMLPTEDMVSRFPMKVSEKMSIGFWIQGNYQFSWIGAVPKDPRGLSDYAFNHALTLDLDLNRVRTVDHYIGLALARYIDLDRNLDLARNRFRKLDRAFDDDLKSAFDRDPSRGINLNSIRTVDFSLVLSRTRNIILIIANNADLGRDLALALEIYVDIFTMIERTARRSPAFEGIRLVRERIR